MRKTSFAGAPAATVNNAEVARVSEPWNQASEAEVRACLDRFRGSSLTLLRSAYGALHQLTFAAWYGNPDSWAQIGYPGPPDLQS